jgi:chromosome segregation ATPase
MYLENWMTLAGVQALILATTLAIVFFSQSRNAKRRVTGLTSDIQRLTKELTQASDAAIELEPLQAELKTAQAELKTAAEAASENAADPEEVADLKKLLHQFTLESRDMLNCIDTLQRENTELKSLVSTPSPDEAQTQATEPNTEGSTATADA